MRQARTTRAVTRYSSPMAKSERTAAIVVAAGRGLGAGLPLLPELARSNFACLGLLVHRHIHP